MRRAGFLARHVLVALLALALPALAAAEVKWSVGDDVMVLDTDGGWYYATVKEVKGNLYRVALPALGERTVDASRIRPQTAEEIATVTGASIPETPAAATGDPGVRRLLDQLGKKFEVDSDGDYRLVESMKGGRTQLVLVLSATQKFGDLNIREVLSPGLKTGGQLTLDTARKALRQNDETKFGAWRTYGSGSGEMLAFAAHVIGDVSAKELQDVIELVARRADEFEQEQLGTDDL